MLMFDNLGRGTMIESAAVEAALTSMTMIDRVLGVSETEVVPTTAVLLFTGNQIGAKGDSASRFLSTNLRVDTPNPQNRRFAHADPREWTLLHRADLMRAAYILLRLGVARRPATLVSRTRFKQWYSSVGWPAEYAASLVGDKIDCDQMFGEVEAGDEERAVVTEAIGLMWSLWGTNFFTAADVAASTQPAANAFPAETEATHNLAPQVLLGILRGLAGMKGTEHLDARRIGQLIKSHLLNRPQPLCEGPEKRPVYVSLTVDKNHEAHRYQIAVRPVDVAD
jgi:hypothetical protein